MRFGRFLLWTLLAVGVLSLGFYLLGNTRLTVQGSSRDGSLTFETRLPNAECRKVVTAKFPFVRLECKENKIPSE